MAFPLSGNTGFSNFNLGFAAASTSAQSFGFPNAANAFWDVTGLSNPWGAQDHFGGLLGSSRQLNAGWNSVLGSVAPFTGNTNFSNGFFPWQPSFLGSGAVNFQQGPFPFQPQFFGTGTVNFGRGPFPNQPQFLGGGGFPFFQTGFFPFQPGFF